MAHFVTKPRFLLFHIYNIHAFGNAECKHLRRRFFKFNIPEFQDGFIAIGIDGFNLYNVIVFFENSDMDGLNLGGCFSGFQNQGDMIGI